MPREDEFDFRPSGSDDAAATGDKHDKWTELQSFGGYIVDEGPAADDWVFIQAWPSYTATDDLWE